MSESFIQGLFAERLGGSSFGKDTKIYKFEKIKRAKAAAMAADPSTEILDFGVGEPDAMAFPAVVKALQIECEKSENRGYADNGIPEFKAAAAEYMARVFGVKGLNPETEIIHSIGSKCALAMMPDAFINKGDAMLMTTPGYPVMATHTEWHGGVVVELPLLEKNAFLPDLKAISAADLKRTKLLYLNYPNNPTGASATAKFFEEVVEFAAANNIIVVHDAAYAALCHTGAPLSFLSTPGAMDVGVEIHSLSKAYNMTGWRIAFLAGNSKVIGAFAHVKDNYDSGQFKAIQKAGVQALATPEITEEISAKYKRRLTQMVEALKESGFNAVMPGGTFYLYVKAPVASGDGTKFGNAEEASEHLIRKAHISTVPWDNAGSYLRFSATFAAADRADEERVISELRVRLAGLGLKF